MIIEQNHEDLEPWKGILKKLALPDMLGASELVGICNEISNIQKTLILTESVLNLSPKATEFYLYTITLDVTKALLDRSNSGCQTSINDVLLNSLETFLKHGHRREYKVYELLDQIFNANKKYYRLNPCNLQQQLQLKGDATFLEGLKEGDEVDVVSCRDQMIGHWMTGKINTIKKEMNVIKVQFEDKYEESVTLGWKVQPKGTRCPSYEWRKQLKQRDIVDAYDTAGVWITATVMSVEPDNMKVEIGFRLYNPPNRAQDSEPYIGWSTKFDTTMSIYDPRIQLKGSRAKAFCKQASKKNNQHIIKDTNDLLLVDLYNQKKIYAVPREESVSGIYFELVDYFGRNNGFDLVLDQIIDKECTPRQVEGILNGLYRLTDRMSRMFAYEFIPKLKDVVWQSMSEWPDTFLRQLTREIIGDILIDIGPLLLRYYSIQEKKEWMSNFSLQIACKCLKSQYLDRKIQGLKMLDDYIKRLQNQRGSDEKFRFIEWVQQYEVFQEIYKPQSHVELLMRSQDFFKYVISTLKTDTIRALWKMISKEDTTIKQIIFKFLNDCSKKLRPLHLEFIFNNLNLFGAADINEDFLELLNDVSKEQLQIKAIEFLWAALVNNMREFRPKMKEKTSDKLIILIKSLYSPSEVLLKLFEDALNRPLGKSIVTVFLSTVYSARKLSPQIIKKYIHHIVENLKTLPEKKYTYLNKILELLIELEQLDERISDEMENQIIKSIKASGAIYLLSFLTKRHSNKLVYPPAQTLTPETFKMVMETFEKTIKVHHEDPKNLPFFEYLLSILDHSNPKVQALACQVTASLYISNYNEIGQKYLERFLTECLLHNSIPYYIILRTLIEGLQTNWPNSTFASIAVPSEEIQITIMNDIQICHDSSRSYAFKMGLNQAVRNIFTYLATKTGLSRLELKLTHNHNQIAQSDSIKTLHEVGLKNNSILHCLKRPPVKKALINPVTKTLSDAAEAIFTETFKEYSNDGKMNNEQFKTFYQKFSYLKIAMEQAKLNRLFQDKQYLTLADFLKHYERQCLDSDYVIRSFLERMGYLSNLVKKSLTHQPDIQKAPTSLLLQNPQTYSLLFRNALTANSIQKQKEIVTILYRLPIYTYFFTGRTVPNLMHELAVQMNPYIIWYCFTVIKYILRPDCNQTYINFSNQTMANWAIEMRENGMDLVILCLRKIYRYYQEKGKVGNYILPIALEDLLTLLHEMVMSKAKTQWKDLSTMIPGLQQLKSPYFVPNKQPPQDVLGLDLKWLLPKIEFNSRINELIYQIMIVEIILDNANCWSLLEIPWDAYKLQRLQMWCVSLSLWKGKLPEIKIEDMIDTKKYELAAFIIQNYSGKCQINFVQLTKKLVAQLREHESLQRRNCSAVDERLVGILTILDTVFNNSHVLAQDYESLAEELMYGFLFPKGDLILPESYFSEQEHKQSVKCFSNESRAKAFSVVASITNKNPNEYEKLMHNFIKKITGTIPIPKKMDRKVSPVRSQLGYVGLRNLGATCYMNAILQQMFCCEPLKRGIMSGTIDDAFLHQLQRMFSYLQFSERIDFEPTQFFKYVRIAGEPAPPNVQQDAHEFLNFFFDRLQQVFKGTPFQKVLRNICYGTIVSQITCQGCGDVRQNSESFYDLKLQVKEKATLYQSLEKLIGGEIISDFYCQKCDKRQSVQKRVLINELPNHLTINLQRIVFNYDTLQNKKIHSKLEFPQLLNLKAFTVAHHKEAIHRKQSVMEDQQTRKHQHQSHDSEYQYRLKGVVIHLGTGQAGHYYSLVKINGKWILFDDSRIASFEDTIQNECFGGLSPEDWAKDVDYSKNAYVLMYERVEKRNLILDNINQSELPSLQLILKHQKKREFEDDPIVIDQSELKEVVINKYWKEVWKDNNLLMEQNMLLSQALSTFICSIFGQIPRPYLPEGNAFYFGELQPNIYELYQIAFNYLIYYTFDIGAKIQIDPKLIYEINKLVRIVPRKTQIILENFFKLQYILGGTKDYRIYIKILYIECLNLEIFLGENKMTKLSTGVLDSFLAQLNNEVAKNWGKSFQYFDLLKDLMSHSNPLIEYFVSKDIISLLIDFIMDKDSPIQISEKKYQIGNSIQTYSLMPICNTIFFALRRHKNLLDEDVFPIQTVTKIPLTNNAKICLQSEQVLKRMMRDRGSMAWINWIIHYLITNNLQYSQKIAKMILVTVGSLYATEDLLHSVGTIQTFLMVSDQFTNERLEYLLGFPRINMNSVGEFCLTNNIKAHIFSYPSTLKNDGKPLKSLLDLLCKDKFDYKPYTLMGINLIVNICLTVDKVFEYMIRLPSPTYLYAHYFQWMEEYLLQFISDGYTVKTEVTNTEFGQKTYQAYSQLSERIKQKVATYEEYIKKTNLIFAEKRGIKLPTEPLPDPTVSKGMTKQFIYGRTFKVLHVKTTQIQPGFNLQIYDHYVYKALSLPSKDNNKAFPRYMTDYKGKIDVYELERYPSLTKLIYTVKKTYNGSTRLELVEEDDGNFIDFDPIFNNTKSQSKKPKHKAEEQLPKQYQEGPIPPLDQTAVIRTFYLVNKTDNRYSLKLIPIKSFLAYLPKQIFAGIQPNQTRLTLTSLEQHDVTTQILGKIEVKKSQMVVQPPILIPADISDIDDKIQCSKCTFFNNLTNQRCEACNSDLFDV